MKGRSFKLLILFAVGTLLFQKSYGQFSATAKLKNFSSALTNLRELKPIEKLYLQTDKPYYSVGDTLRFKGYLLNADYLTPTSNSGLLYIELHNEQGKSAKRIMVPVTSGLAWGDIALDSVDVPNGTYTLRAYTNWMRNFGEDYIFKKTITVSKSTDNPLLVKAKFKQVGNKVEAQLLFSLLDGRIQAFKDVELKVMNGKRNLSKDKVATGVDGSVKVNFTLPEGDGALSIQATTTESGLLNIPVLFNRKENTDVQFMPEGGHLVAGLPAKIGFKAIAEDGKGFNVSGKILDSKGAQVAAFAATHAGMGSFDFTPVGGEVYTAKVDGINKAFALPGVKPSGTSMAISAVGDSIRVTIATTPDAKGIYSLVAQARGVVCFAQTVSTPTISVAKKLFPTGIVRFSLLNSNNQAINERIVFVNLHDDMRISFEQLKASYGIRDSIALSIKVTDKDGKPVEGNFLLAVTDDSQVKRDSLGTTILNNLLFTSDLKGNIEDPGYYFTADKETDLDNLLLTQGWIGYDWQEVFHPKLPYTYKPEKEFVVSGTVTNAFGKPIEKSNIVLFANNPPAIKDTLTDNIGEFTFKNLFPVDSTAVFKLQARNKKGKEMNVKIDMDEFQFPTFNPNSLSTPWYLNIDSIALNNSRTRMAEERALSNIRGEGNLLKAVNVKAKKIIPGSKNLNGPGEADFFIDEEEIKKMPSKKTLEEMLQEKFPGFITRGGFWNWRTRLGDSGTSPLSYVWNGKKVRFVFDGIDLDFFFTKIPNMVDSRYFNIKPILDYFTAEDIVGIEIMENIKYSAGYHEALRGTNSEFLLYLDRCYTYIEITTHAKQGPFMKAIPGTALYRATPFSIAKQFYSPKYNMNNKGTALGTDLRSTIFWEANMVTDKQGKASVHFYSADKAATYTVLVEGTDLDGALGVGRQKIIVK